MRVIGQDKLKLFTSKHAEYAPALQSWLAEARDASWTCHDAISAKYKLAEISANGNVSFSIDKGAIKLIAKVIFRKEIIRIDEVRRSVNQTADLKKLAGGK